jgi:hypothetical protein
MDETKIINVSDGINPITATLDFRPFKKKFNGEIVVRTNKKPVDFRPDNPDPEGPFMGKDGKWYKIVLKNRFYSNCYLTAMKWITPVKNNLYGIPGFLVGKVPFTLEEIKECIIQDLNVCGRRVHEIIEADDIPEALPAAEKGTYWVKGYYESDNIGSFHIAFKHEESGRWIHKLGWQAPVKVVMRNIEYYCPYDDLMKNPLIAEFYNHMSRSEFISFCLSTGLYSLTGGVSKSTWEDKDNAPYFSYSPDTNPNGFTVFNPAFVMRIDE